MKFTNKGLTNNLYQALMNVEPTQAELKARKPNRWKYPEKGITSKECSDRVQVSKSAVSHWLNKKNGISPCNQLKILKKCGFREARLTFIK